MAAAFHAVESRDRVTAVRGARRGGRVARLFAPDLALAVSIVTLFYSIFFFDAPRKLFRDSDTGWHIVTGERILNQKQLPDRDPYSFTRPGQPWFAWEWVSDCLMGFAYTKAGLPGVVWIFVIAIAAATWLWFKLNWAVNGNFFLACALAAPMLSTVNLHWLARPHLFGWLLLLAAIWYFENAPNRFRARDAIAIVLATVVWTNVHASFFLLPAIALVYAVSHLARPLIWNLEPQAELQMTRWYLIAAAVSAAATFLNPYGWNLHLHVARYLMNSDLLDRVGEFQSFNFHVSGASQILLAIGVAALGGALAIAQKKLAHFLLAVMFLAAALRSARALPIAALVLLPLANGAITDALRRAHDLRISVRHSLNAFLSYSDRLRILDSRLSGVGLAPVAAVLAFLWLQVPAVAAHTGFPPDQFPVVTANELTLLPQNIRLLAPDMYGGYLIYRFQGARKVFFDGRSDFYGSDFMKAYIRLVEARPGWQAQVQAFGFTHALLPNDYTLVSALQQAGWRIVFRDDVATLLAARPESGSR